MRIGNETNKKLKRIHKWQKKKKKYEAKRGNKLKI